MNSYVVVFPSPFARSKSALLASNVKKILKVKELAYDSIRRDGQIIIVDAKDPVFASSAIGLLYGIERVAIAKKVGNGFDETVKEMAKVGSSLLLREDKFFIKVGGVPLGTTVADLELAATSAIIESSSESGALPGTANDHNRLLYTHVTKNGSYVCIFIDEGLGGLPQGAHSGTILCCVYDELSALACLETIKCGFKVKIIICHKGGSDLRKLVKMTNSILARSLVCNFITSSSQFFQINNLYLVLNSKSDFSPTRFFTFGEKCPTYNTFSFTSSAKFRLYSQMNRVEQNLQQEF